VTERRALEARLRSAEKLESIGRLAGGVAHDFNNMLTAILGNLSFAASVDSLEEVRPLLDEARVAAERSAALTAQLLAFARKQVIEPKVIAPDEAIRRLEGLLRRLLDEQKKLELTLSARGHVRIAESQFEQVVMNLVTNAREALAGAGSISIETRDLFIDEADGKVIGVPPGAYVTLAVSDTGRGIAPEIRPFLFEPFFTTREGGTGLGLATCYGIVKQNGGTISVDSELDRGATFRVYLPRVEADELVASVRPPAPRSAGALKVLIVEDEENVRRVLGRSLAGREFEVFIAPSAEAARKLGDQHGPFDVLLTDVMMPDVHGQELAQELRGRWPDLRVLFLSGYAQGLSLKDQPQDSTVRLLQKPFHPSELVEAVQQLVSDTKSAPRARSYDPT
jgi:two-component system, cell cycle sensor histidine kinase and response regulator CckA